MSCRHPGGIAASRTWGACLFVNWEPSSWAAMHHVVCSNSRMASASEFKIRVIALASLLPCSLSVLITARTAPFVVGAVTVRAARSQRRHNVVTPARRTCARNTARRWRPVLPVDAPLGVKENVFIPLSGIIQEAHARWIDVTSFWTTAAHGSITMQPRVSMWQKCTQRFLQLKTVLSALDAELTIQCHSSWMFWRTRSQAVARIADRTAKNCRGHVTWATPTFRGIFCAPACHSPYKAVYQIEVSSSSSFRDIAL